MTYKTKLRLTVILGIIIFILLIAFLIYQKRSTNTSEPSAGFSSVESSDFSISDDEITDSDEPETTSNPDGPGSNTTEEGLDSGDLIWNQDIEYSVSEDPCEEWPSVDASGYCCNVVSYEDVNLNGTITVGVDGASVSGDNSGLILQIGYSNASKNHAVGVTFTCSTGVIGYATENGTAQLTGMSGMSQVSRDIYPAVSINNAPVVALGRTWDYQLDITYYDSNDYGICWYYDPMAMVPDNAVVTFRMFDLTSGYILGIYEIDIINDNGIMTLDSVHPTTISNEAAACVDQIRQLVFSAADQVPFNISIAEGSSIFLQDLETPYYLDARLLDGTTFLPKYADLYGDLIGVTVSSNSYKIGSVTYYFAISPDSSDFGSSSETGYTAQLIGYDLPITWSWDMFTEFNVLDESSDSYRAYLPSSNIRA